MKDERIQKDLWKTNSISYRILWAGLFIVLIYRWFILRETLIETGDIFAVWLIASIVNFLMYAIHGIPPHYPASMSRRQSLTLLLAIPAFSGGLSVVLTAVRGALQGVGHAFRIFALVYFILLGMFGIYGLLVHLWEKRNLDPGDNHGIDTPNS